MACCLTAFTTARWTKAAARFGEFQINDRRTRLWARFTEFMGEVKACDLMEAVLLDGSFVTAKPDPNDIDLVLVVSANYDFSADFQPSEYNVLSKRRVNGALDSTSWSPAPTRRNTVATWGSFNKSAWNPVAKRGY